MAQIEPMDVDNINDNKENAFVLNNVQCGQENAEVLNSSEYLMKLRYSTTPVSSPMSKSYTVIADKNIDNANKCNMTQSLNLTVKKSDTTFTGPKSLPLQTIPLEDAADKTINVLKQLDSLISDNGDVNITVSNALEHEENVSLPSSVSITPEAVTPTKEIQKPIGSPILRGIQSVFNMFRTSQSPASPHDDEDDEHAAEVKSFTENPVADIENSITASTPLNIHKKSDSISSRDSRDRDSTIFNEKLEKDLEWNETTIIFSKEKFPIHKLLFQQSNSGPLPDSSTIGDVSMASFNHSYEAMDVSCDDFAPNNKTLQENNVTSTLKTENVQSNEITGSEKDESVFLDCETTLNESQAKNIDKASSRTQDKTLNDTSFISVQSAETVTCTFDMAENLIVSKSFVQENQDINPIPDINCDFEKHVDTDTVVYAVSFTTDRDQGSHDKIVESQITKTPDENNKQPDETDKSTIRDKVLQCQVNVLDATHTEENMQSNIPSMQCVQQLQVAEPQIKTSDANEIIETDENLVIQVQVNILDEKLTEVNVEGQGNQLAGKLITSHVPSEPAGLVCTDLNISQIESPSMPKCDQDNKDINLNKIDCLENAKISDRIEVPSGNFDDTLQSELNVLVVDNNISQSNEVAGSIDLVNDFKLHETSDDIVSSTQDALIRPPNPDERIEADTTIDVLKFPAVVDIKPDGSLIITTDDKESFEISTTEEDISMVNADMLVPEDEQDEDLSNATPTEKNDISEKNISAACINSQILETVNQDIEKPKSHEYQCKEEEIIISESNSPYVSLGAEATNTGSLKENSITSSEVKSCPPESPKITSVGYNFNFDEINPFATRTRLSISPSRQVSIDKLTKSPVVSQIMESFPKISEEKTPAINIFNTKDCVTSLEKPTEISKDEIIKTETLNSIEIVPDNESKEELNSVPIELTNKNLNDSKLKFIPEVTPIPVSNENSKEEEVVNVQIISSQFYSLGASSCEIDETVNSSGDKNKIESLQNGQNKNLANKVTPVKVDSQLLAEKADKKDEGNQSNDLNSMVNTHIENKANITDVPDVPDNESDLSIACSDDKDDTVREVHTKDEDTAEGPNIESQIDSKENCFSGFVSVKSDCGLFDDLPPEAKDEAFEPIESAEMFIDAEAFDFLMSQNRSNEVISSGKESLFLKFDPLFAKRVNSDGVLDILSKVQKRQSTPKKLKHHQSIMDMSNEEKPGPSTGNRTFDMQVHDSTINTRPKPQTGDYDESLNEPYPKPTMIVTPVVPYNNMKTPSRSIRRSSGVHSPAIAVIDRLLSISANNSLAYDDSTVIHYNAEQEEADRALIQLRDLVAVKELEVYQLKSESKELKARLFTLESQMENLDREGEQRLKAINALNEKLNEKVKINKSMKDVVEEYEKTIAGLIAEIESDKKRNAEEKIQLIRDRDEQTAHLANMEGAFSDLHSKYEKSKQIILSYKANEDAYKKSVEDFEASLIKMEKNYDALKEHATAQLDHANQELEKINKAHESEVVKLKAMMKRKDLHITSLEENIAQKIKANEELTAICDELISKVG